MGKWPQVLQQAKQAIRAELISTGVNFRELAGLVVGFPHQNLPESRDDKEATTNRDRILQ
jgi:hypothetical protein